MPPMQTDERPETSGGATKVSASIIVADFLGVDDVNQQLDLDLLVTLKWTDPRLKGLDGCRFSIDKVWSPSVLLFNSSQLRAARSNARAQIAVGTGGQITFVNRYRGLVSSYHNLREFPFDKHSFRLDFGSVEDTADNLQLVADTQHTWISKRLNIEGWSVKAVSLSSHPHDIKQSGKRVSVLTLKIDAKRSPDYFIYRVILLLAFVVGMSWIIFWIPPSRFEFQIGLGATSMLTAIAFNLSIANSLPRLGYLTILDKMVIWSVFLIFLSIVEALLAGLLVISEKDRLALAVDRTSRWLFPILLVFGWSLMSMRLV